MTQRMLLAVVVVLGLAGSGCQPKSGAWSDDGSTGDDDSGDGSATGDDDSGDGSATGDGDSCTGGGTSDGAADGEDLPESTEIGRVMFCLGNELDVDIVEDQSVSGVAVAHRAPTGSETLNYGCHMPYVDEILEIVDDDGTSWWLAYGVQDSDDERVMPALDVDIGAEIELRFGLYVDMFNYGATLILRDEGGLVVFGNRQLLSPAFGPDAVPEVEVSEGPVTGEAGDECLEITHHALEFAADNRVVVAPGQEKALQVECVGFTAHTIVNYTSGEMLCGGSQDEADHMSWAVWRNSK